MRTPAEGPLGRASVRDVQILCRHRQCVILAHSLNQGALLCDIYLLYHIALCRM